jgi:virulence-associated protein VapD
MSVTKMRFGGPRQRQPMRRNGRVYAIAFDLHAQTAEKLCGANWRGTCYDQIERVLGQHGFYRQQGSLYFGNEDSNPVTCVTAVQAIDNRYAWFSRAVRDLRMLRIDENNDLLPALSNELRLGRAVA